MLTSHINIYDWDLSSSCSCARFCHIFITLQPRPSCHTSSSALYTWRDMNAICNGVKLCIKDFFHCKVTQVGHVDYWMQSFSKKYSLNIVSSYHFCCALLNCPGINILCVNVAIYMTLRLRAHIEITFTKSLFWPLLLCNASEEMKNEKNMTTFSDYISIGVIKGNVRHWLHFIVENRELKSSWAWMLLESSSQYHVVVSTHFV